MELAEIFLLYSNRQPLYYEIKETSRGEADFRQLSKLGQNSSFE